MGKTVTLRLTPALTFGWPEDAAGKHPDPETPCSPRGAGAGRPTMANLLYSATRLGCLPARMRFNAFTPLIRGGPHSCLRF